MNSYDINERFERVIEGLRYAGEIKSQAELARLMEVSSSTISEIVKKRQGLTLEFIQKLCMLFRQINVNFLLFGRESMWNDLDDFSSPSEESLRILLKEKENQISDFKIMLKEKDDKIEKLIEEKTELKMLLQESKKDIKRDVKPKSTDTNNAAETA